MPPVNNVTRLLESRKVRYTAYETPAAKLSALEVAQLLDVSPNMVFKTIVVTRAGSAGKKPILAVVPGSCDVDLKALAAFLGEKKAQLATEREAEELTGLEAGGISPLALLNRGFQVILDDMALGLREIHVSGGQRGLNIKLPVEDFLSLTKARIGPLCRKSGPS